MKECWINVYDPNWWLNQRPLSEQLKFTTRQKAIDWSNMCKDIIGYKVKYRLHVKLKNV